MDETNLVYPDRVELDALMKGPRAPGKCGAWIGVPPTEKPQRAPNLPLREWLRIAESSRQNPHVNVMTLIRGEQPLVATPPPFVPFQLAITNGEANKPSENQDNARQRLRLLFQRIANRVTLSRVVVDMPNEEVSGDVNETPQEEEIRNNRSIPILDEIPEITFPKISKDRHYCHLWDFNKCHTVIDPNGTLYFLWLFWVSLAYIYNLVAIPLRASFPYQNKENELIWISFDIFWDIFYMIDILFIKPRVSYLEDGEWILDPQVTKNNYRKSLLFKLDLLSLLPLEILYLYFGTSAVMLRFPKFFKGQTLSRFYDSIDRMLSSPLIIRVARTLIYTFYLIHLNACAYYKMSDYEGIGSNGWVYSGEGNAYIRCFYFATKTSTSIGKNPKPENELEYIYMTFAWLMGVCVFALLVGQIRHFMITASKAQTEYRNLLAETLKCMRQLNIPCDLQKKVTSWFEFTWKQQRTLDDNRALSALPQNLKAEVAISMHIQTLSKVRLFTDCDEALLRDLVLRLRSNIFLPGDLICRKGDVGREMYIVKRGDVEVMGGLNNNEVIATLSEGSVFGEISLLNINGINRRTADVRSQMFTNIFILSRDDFNSVIEHYPEALKLLMKRAKELMNINAARHVIDESDDATEESDDSIEAEFMAPNQSKVVCEINDASAHYSGVTNDGKVTPIEQSSEDSTLKNCTEEEHLDKITDAEANKCYCEKLRRRAMPRHHKRQSVVTINRAPNLYSMKNFKSEPCLKKKCARDEHDKTL